MPTSIHTLFFSFFTNINKLSNNISHIRRTKHTHTHNKSRSQVPRVGMWVIRRGGKCKENEAKKITDKTIKYIKEIVTTSCESRWWHIEHLRYIWMIIFREGKKENQGGKEHKAKRKCDCNKNIRKKTYWRLFDLMMFQFEYFIKEWQKTRIKMTIIYFDLKLIVVWFTWI